ncbi:hypothetical protein QBC39DRAFT_90562 [Podospora conica]|nr:hypothetical protein QBC39DRAFT_90562 [Schizothecium conicum]
MDEWGITTARMRGRPLLLLVEGAEVMEGWRTLWDGDHAASGGGRPDNWMAWLDRNNHMLLRVARCPRPRISRLASVYRPAGRVVDAVGGQHDHHIQAILALEGRAARRLQVVDAPRWPGGSPWAARCKDRATAAQRRTNKDGGKATGKLWSTVDRRRPLAKPTNINGILARATVSSNLRAPIRKQGKETCAVNGGLRRQLPHEVDLRFPLGTAQGTFAYRWRCVVSAGWTLFAGRRRRCILRRSRR